jgi:hypothetical protein
VSGAWPRSVDEQCVARAGELDQILQIAGLEDLRDRE